MALTVKTSELRKLIREAMYKNMPGDGEPIPPFMGRRPKTVKARINQIYSLVNKYGLSSRKYTDDAWKATSDYKRLIESLGYEVWFDVKNGGYGDYDPNDNRPRSKTYDITIESEDGMVIEGYIKMCAAGSNEDPFDAYDTCMILWPKQRRAYNESILKSDLRKLVAETVGGFLCKSSVRNIEGDENMVDFAYNAAMDLAERTDTWFISPRSCGDEQFTEGEDGMALKENLEDGMELSIDCGFNFNTIYRERLDDFDEPEYDINEISVCINGKDAYCYFELGEDDPLYQTLVQKIQFDTDGLKDYPYYSEDDEYRDERDTFELYNSSNFEY